MTIDEKDHILLSMLRRDSRTPVVALAQKVGLSRSATQARLERLEQAGIVRAYTVSLGAGVGPSPLTAFLALKLSSGFVCEDIMPGLRRMPQVCGAWSVTGEIDLLVRIDAASVADLDRLRVTIAKLKGVTSVATHLALRTHLDQPPDPLAVYQANEATIGSVPSS